MSMHFSIQKTKWRHSKWQIVAFVSSVPDKPEFEFIIAILRHVPVQYRNTL